MADARRGHQVQHAVENAVAGAQDGDEAELLAGELRRQHGLERRVGRDAGERQVAGDLVGEQQADLADEMAELRGGRVPVAQQGQLVLDQRMVDHGNGGRGGHVPDRRTLSAVRHTIRLPGHTVNDKCPEIFQWARSRGDRTGPLKPRSAHQPRSRSRRYACASSVGGSSELRLLLDWCSVTRRARGGTPFVATKSAMRRSASPGCTFGRPLHCRRCARASAVSAQTNESGATVVSGSCGTVCMICSIAGWSVCASMGGGVSTRCPRRNSVCNVRRRTVFPSEPNSRPTVNETNLRPLKSGTLCQVDSR